MLDNLVLKKYIYGLFGFTVGEHPYNELHSKPTPATLAAIAAAAAALAGGEGNATTTTDRAPIGANEPRVEELPNDNLTSSSASTTTTAGVKKESSNDKKSSSASDLD